MIVNKRIKTKLKLATINNIKSTQKVKARHAKKN